MPMDRGRPARMDGKVCADAGLPARSLRFAPAEAGEDARGPSTAAQISNDYSSISFMQCSFEHYDPPGSLVNPNGATSPRPSWRRQSEEGSGDRTSIHPSAGKSLCVTVNVGPATEFFKGGLEIICARYVG